MEKPKDYDTEEAPVKKYYAVKSGRTPGIYRSWAECKENIFQVKGAIYKSFETEAEALAFMGAGSDATAEDIEESDPIAYIDGSNKKDPAQYGYGGFLKAGGKIFILQGSGSNPKLLDHRNVAGELYGATMAIKKAQELGLPELTIVYDYEGIGQWASGAWERNTYLTQWYYNFCKTAAETIKLRFVHVDGHTGNAGNEMADILAKEAVGATLRKKDQAAIANFKAQAEPEHL